MTIDDMTPKYSINMPVYEELYTIGARRHCLQQGAVAVWSKALVYQAEGIVPVFKVPSSAIFFE